MKRRSFLIFLVFIMGFFAFSQSLNEILDCTIKAYGGKEALNKVKDIHLVGKVVSMGVELPMEIYIKNPNKIRVEVKFQGNKIIQVFDGKKGWSINPMISPEPKEMDKKNVEQIENYNSINFFTEYKKLGFTATYVGTEDLEGAEAYKIKFVKKGREPFYFFIDKESCIPVKIDVSTKRGNSVLKGSIYFSNYKKVEGVYFPFSVRMVMGKMESNVVFSSIKVNENISDSLFEIKEKKGEKGDSKNEKN